MKTRLLRFLGAIAFGVLIISMIASCSKHHTSSKKYASTEGVTQSTPPPPPPRKPMPPTNTTSVTQGNNAAKDNSWKKTDSRNAAPADKRIVTPQPQNSVADFKANESLGEMTTEIPEPIAREEEVEVAEDASGGYDDYYSENSRRDGDTDPLRQMADAQRKEEEKSKLDADLKEIQNRMREMDNSANRNEADRKRMQQDLARTQEQALVKGEEVQRALEKEMLENVKATKSEIETKRKADEIRKNQDRRQAEIERPGGLLTITPDPHEQAKLQAQLREQRTAQTAEIAKLKKELEEVKRQEALKNLPIEPVGREDYAHIDENDFTSPLSEPLSTFSIDVDKAAYANTRRYLNSGSLPPAGAVRIEELVNYFHYDYRQPFSSQPFAFNTETSSCPWNSDHQLVHIGLKGREIDRSEMPASNLVFLIDVSGSMNNANKLPLLKKAFNMLIDNLNGQDRVAIVVYAGAAGIVLPSTPASQKGKIMQALNNLSAGGSTAGGAGIQLAYQIARNHLIKGGNNRVILATDGDFNVGPSSESALIEMIESKRKEGVFLSVLGFGTGNYQDRRMEQIADHGNGNYAYIDNLKEAQKVLVQEMGGTLHAIAKDVKIQIEFNPTYVKAYRLIGYENRVLAAQDFNDDTKDAGELGAGHTVTALYEIVPHSANTPVSGIDPLKYQQLTPSNLSTGVELMTLKFRYKEPDGDVSKLLTEVVKTSDKTLSATSENYRFSASVAAFGMLLRGSRYSGDADYDMVIDMASNARGRDEHGYRAEFLQLVQRAKQIDNRSAITGN